MGENKFTKGQLRKLKTLRKSVGDRLGKEVFRKWLAQQETASTSNSDSVALKIEEALAGFSNDKSFNLGVYGYAIRCARGKGAPEFVAIKNGHLD